MTDAGSRPTALALRAALHDSEAWFGALVAHSSDIITVLDAGGRVKYSSPAAMRIFGYEPGFMLGQSAFDLVHPDDLEHVRSQFVAELATPGPGRPIEFRMRSADGTWRDVEAVGTNLLDEPGVEGVVINSRDITDRKRAEAALRESEERYRRLVEHTPDAIAIHCGGKLVYINPAGLALLGADRVDQVLGLALLDFVDPQYRAVVSERMQLATREIVALREERIVRLDNSVVDIEAVAIPTTFEGQPAAQVVARDVTDSRRAEADLAHRALHDPLTELANRELLLDRLNHALARGERTGRRVALLFIDLDGFKEINDCFGHTAGDEVLVKVSARLAQATRAGDTIARYGGDEFLVLCEELSGDDEIEAIVARVLASLDAPFDLAGTDVAVSASIGTATAHGGRADDLIREADEAMYRIKQQRRGVGARPAHDPPGE